MDSRKRKTVFAIVERDGRSWWHPHGVGFVNADGSIDVKLDAIPQNGALQIRDAVRRPAHVQESGT
jgi:hypothetical protein